MMMMRISKFKFHTSWFFQFTLDDSHTHKNNKNRKRSMTDKSLSHTYSDMLITHHLKNPKIFCPHKEISSSKPKLKVWEIQNHRHSDVRREIRPRIETKSCVVVCRSSILWTLTEISMLKRRELASRSDVLRVLSVQNLYPLQVRKWNTN